MPGVGSLHASESVARPRVPQSASQSRRQPRRGGRHRASERAHDSDSEDVAIDVDLLIDMVRDREPLWNMADRFHADASVTRLLWEEVCHAVVSNWEELHSRAQNSGKEFSCGGGQCGITSRRISTKRCRLPSDQEDAGAAINILRPCYSYQK
ncbi:acyl-CoA-binding domain-containing protein 7 isoform X2 [Dendrobates tinctorius]|uniref:acyl-CoA-binding domain-containing protein 7 isoform X2 n=1 Tax=Dendrobates tinctorius TaxID=92724 RepID=UPI003CC99282